MARRMSKREIGLALSHIREDIVKEVLALVKQYYDLNTPDPVLMLKQAVDTPHRARVRLQTWATNYDAQHSPGDAVIFLNECLVEAGSTETVASLNAAVLAMETQALNVVDGVNNNGWTWDQVANWLEANVGVNMPLSYTYSQLPLPPGYISIWGDSW